MANFSDKQIAEIVHLAQRLQKYGGNRPSPQQGKEKELQDIYRITDEMGIERRFAYEAYLDKSGIPVHDPIIVDTGKWNQAEAVGFTGGTLDAGLFKEIQDRIEYHFNTTGSVITRKNRSAWKAKSSGISRLFASSKNKEVIFDNVSGGLKITVKKSLKAINRMLYPGLIAGIGAFFLMAGSFMEASSGDQLPMFVVSMFMFAGTAVYFRFFTKKRKQKKKELANLVEIIQHIIERRNSVSPDLIKKLERDKAKEDHDRIEMSDGDEYNFDDRNRDSGDLSNDLREGEKN